MKAVICAGGSGTRLLPLTKAINKHLLPVGVEPMILRIVRQIRSCGISSIAIVTTSEGMTPISAFLGDGSDYKCDITYFCQNKPLGITHAILCTENFIAGDNFMVILGDNIFDDDISNKVKKFCDEKQEAHFFLKKVKNPSQFGIAKLDGNDLTDIIEKPKNPPSDYCVTGIYLYKNSVLGQMKLLTPSSRGEFEISDVNSKLANSKKASYTVLEKFWIDAGTLEDYVLANKETYESYCSF